jgi:uncharacterized protein (DUF2237 family)
LSVEQLPGVPTSPLVMLHKLLEDIDSIKSLVVVVGWKEAHDAGVTHQVCWTAQPTSQLALAAVATQQLIGREVLKP